MICHTKKCIFVHIPKTAGSSIEDAIWGDDLSIRTVEHLWMGAVRPGYNKYQSGGLQHLLAPQIRQEVGNDIFSSYYKFSFVRNPWAKVVSQFYYLKTRPDLLQMMGLHRWSPFRSYLKALEKSHEMHVQSMEQHQFIYTQEEGCIVDFVGRFENLHNDFRIVSNRLGMGDVSLPHARKSKRTKPYQTFYTARQRQLIETIYQRDIQLFDYSFD